jgi:two-component system response regulator LytT
MSINILVVEDESIVRKDIEQSLKKLGYQIVGHADTGERAVELALSLHPDIIMMDIMLKGKMTGIEAANKIKQEKDIPVIYLTAYADQPTLDKAKVTEPHGYLIKPFKETDLHTAIEMAVHKHKKEVELKVENDLLRSLTSFKTSADYLFIKHHSRLSKLNTTDVYYVEALKDYVMIYTKDQKYTIHGTMKDIEKKLPMKVFQRVHRSFIVNMDKIEGIIGSSVIIQDLRREIPVGGNYKEELASRINIL